MTKRNIEIFSAGCPACDDTIALVNSLVCASCAIEVLDMKDAGVAERARALGIRAVLAVVVDGRLIDCCAGQGGDEVGLRAAGIGSPRA